MHPSRSEESLVLVGAYSSVASRLRISFVPPVPLYERHNQLQWWIGPGQFLGSFTLLIRSESCLNDVRSHHVRNPTNGYQHGSARSESRRADTCSFSDFDAHFDASIDWDVASYSGDTCLSGSVITIT